MRRVATLVLAYAGCWLSLVLAQEPTPARNGPMSPAATQHKRLPGDLSQYWFVPGTSELDTGRANARLARLVGGVKAMRAGDFSTALSLVSGQGLDETALSNYAKYYRAVALQGLSRLQEADAALTALINSRPVGYLGEAARLKLADVAIARGDDLRAEQILREAVARAPSEPEQTLMTLGQVEVALEHWDHAVEAYRSVYFTFPLSDRAAAARAALDLIGSRDGVRPPSVADELSRAERLFAARRWTDARAAFATLVGALSGADKELAAVRQAECDLYLGRHRAARDGLAPYLSGSSREPEARYAYLSAVRGTGDRAAYIALTRALVADHPDSSWAIEALNDLASYYVVQDDLESADRVFRELLARFPSHRYSERAAWKVGWAAYRRGQFAETAMQFDSAAARFPRADYRPAWLYWSGRARDRMGDRAGALARFQLAVTDYGNSYYGRLATGQLASRSEPAQSRARSSNPDGIVTGPPNKSVIQALMTAGLLDDALREVQYAARTWGETAQLSATLAWIRNQQAQALRADERFAALRGAITTMKRAYPQFLSAEGEFMPPEILRIIFPLDYWDLIEKQAKANALDPFLLAALTAQESTFTADIRSAADARGLMQVMPSTGRVYARKLGIRPYSVRSLERPEINVRIGVTYFKDLLERFGAVHYALAGYNAGEARVAQWIKDGADLPPDEFIDDIPFPETQGYIKRILGTSEDYRRLYGTAPLSPSRRLASSTAD